MINQMSKSTLLVLALLATGCQSGYRNAAKESMGQYVSGDYQLAASTAIQFSESNSKSKMNRVVYNLESGRMAQVAGDYKSSEIHYDLAYDDVRPFLDEKAENKVTEAVVTTVVNQTLSEYKATPGERIMLNTLNALNYIATGDFDLARVELRRAKDWQQDARYRYKKQIEKARAAVEAELRKKNVGQIDQGSIEEKLMTEHQGYGDYQNPFTDHLHAIFVIAQGGDRSEVMKDLYAIYQNNPRLKNHIIEDFNFLSSASDGSEAPSTTWIYFMTGVAPSLKENKIRIPVPIRGIDYIVAVFPEMVFHDDYVSHIDAWDSRGRLGRAITLKSAKIDSTQSSELVNMDRILGNEFNIRLPLIIQQEIASAILKAIITKAALKKKSTCDNCGVAVQDDARTCPSCGNKIKKGGFLGTFLATSLVKEVSASADLRSWRSLPKQIQLCRISTPSNGSISIIGGGNIDLGQVNVTPNKHNVVVITMPSMGVTQPSIISATLN